MSNIIKHHINQHMHSYTNSSIYTSYNNSSNQNYSWRTRPFEKLTILPKTFIFGPKADSKKKCMKRHNNMNKICFYWVTRRGGMTSSPWRANIAPCHTVVRRGEQMTSKHCSLLRYSSPWRTMTDFCRKVRFFTPKTQFSSTPIPNLIGNSTCDHSTIWTSIIHNSMDFLHLLTANSTCSIINSNFKP